MLGIVGLKIEDFFLKMCGLLNLRDKILKLSLCSFMISLLSMKKSKTASCAGSPLFAVILFLCFKLFIAVGNLAESKQLDIYAPRPVTDTALFYPIL